LQIVKVLSSIMTENKTEKSDARPTPSRAFFKRLPLPLPSPKAHLAFWSLAAGGLALDLWTKKAIFDWLEPGEVFGVINGLVQLVRATNNGAAFGMLAGKPYFLTATSIIALAVILAVFLFGGSRQKLVLVALALFSAGVCGNLYDRLFNDGLVRDFVDAYYRDYHWPAFNVADSLLCIGVGLLIISTLSTERPAQRHAQQHK
jgi:signal peptidase II